MAQDFDFLMRGGPVMLPLFLCGFVAIAVMIDRLIAIGIAVHDNRTLVARVEELIKAGKFEEALRLCEESPGRVAALIASGLRHKHLDRVTIERCMEEFALRQLPILQERLNVLDMIVTLAPLLGLLGTVTGMVNAFHVVSTGGALNNPLAITGGVSEALIATSVGLTIAIIALPVYNFLTERVKENVSEMEWRATQLMNMLPRPVKVQEPTDEIAPNGA